MLINLFLFYVSPVFQFSLKEIPMGLEASSEEEYSYQSRLLQDFMNIPSIDKAWTFTSNSGMVKSL